MIKADTKYNGTVMPGSALTETGTGTVSFQVNLQCEDGNAVYNIWMTDKNRENARKAFTALGVTPEQLQDSNYFEYQLGQDIEGREVAFGTKAEEYKGKTTIKVAWIGKHRDQLDGGLASAAAKFFGGKGKEPNEDKWSDNPEDPF